jgi:hypothetical protein
MWASWDNLVGSDVDGAEGKATLRGPEPRLGALPQRQTVATPSGGRHLQFDCTPQLALITLVPGLEVKALSHEAPSASVERQPSCRMPGPRRSPAGSRNATCNRVAPPRVFHDRL